MNFLHDLQNGRAAAQDIDHYVVRWREAPMGSEAARLDLHEFLGLTWDQYAAWMGSGKLPRLKG